VQHVGNKYCICNIVTLKICYIKLSISLAFQVDVFQQVLRQHSVFVLSHVLSALHTGGADKSARPVSRFILFDGENASFHASLVLYIYIYIYIYILLIFLQL
jgi:hypothetical protein